MARRLQATLKAARIMGYRDDKVGDEMYEVHFPLLRKAEASEKSFRAIKPLDLDKQRPTAITEHGDAWLAKLDHLTRMHYDVSRVLFAVQLPHGNNRKAQAAQLIIDEIRGAGAQLAEMQDIDTIREFARAD